jgi:hypothetical protein
MVLLMFKICDPGCVKILGDNAADVFIPFIIAKFCMAYGVD